MREKISDFDQIKEIIIHTSHHTHYVIGTGAGDPQKMDPRASRETLDHSIMYIFAVALQDGECHHVKSYEPQRAQRKDTVQLWNKIKTVEDPKWTQMYHDPDPAKKAFGARIEIKLKSGEIIEDEMARANAHPDGARPFERSNYLHKFKTLTQELILPSESERFLDKVQNLKNLTAKDLLELNVQVDLNQLSNHQRDQRGIF